VDCPSGQHDGHQGAERTQRADARRNRAQILQAGEILFAEQGIGVPIDEIAKRAGVGVGTVYRHFPTKEALGAAVVITRMEGLAAEAKALGTSDDPTGALFVFMSRLAEEGLAKRDLIDALSGAGIDFKEISSDIRTEMEGAAELLLKRAQQAGTVRSDIEVADLFGLVMGACTMSNKESKCSQSRMMAVVCAGLRSDHTEPFDPPTAAQIAERLSPASSLSALPG
jgi:AcrR family transcriptional regulator